MRPDVRPLRSSEIGAAAETLALAFDEDPMFRFLLPESDRRAYWLRWFHSLTVRQSVSAGGAYTFDEGPGLGAMALMPPGAWPVPLWSTLRAMPLPTRPPPRRLLTAGASLLRRAAAVHPRRRHLYLYALGVHPAQKGRGLGGALLRMVRDLARAERCEVYLETTNPANLIIYRRFGFEVKDTIQTRGGPPLWTMSTDDSAGVEAM